MEDTIAAIATALGEGGIGIVRLSGNEALKIAAKVFKPYMDKDIAKVPAYSVHYGHVIYDDNIIDEALLLAMRSPRSYTAEDVVELHCHGGAIAVRKVLHAVLSSGARLAEPGEFTKRAFINGRLDLSQAEAVIEIIRAKTDKAMELAVNRLSGKLKDSVKLARHKVLAIIAHIEALIDFPEDDVEEVSYNKLIEQTASAVKDIQVLIKQSGQGKIYQDGIKAAIIGKPNVGKSSLLNALIGENKAIVTHIPGTTRDIIEEWLNIEGIPVKIIDTAGIRESTDIVEKIGIEKSLQTMKEADIVLFVIDVETGISSTDKEFLNLLNKERVIILINKLDLSQEKALELIEQVKQFENLAVSAKEEIGIKELADKIKEALTGEEFDLTGDSAVGNVRHLHALEKAEKHLLEAIEGMNVGMGYDFLSIDLRSAWEALGEITGDVVGEDLLSHIFANFCIGK